MTRLDPAELAVAEGIREHCRPGHSTNEDIARAAVAAHRRHVAATSPAAAQLDALRWTADSTEAHPAETQGGNLPAFLLTEALDMLVDALEARRLAEADRDRWQKAYGHTVWHVEQTLGRALGYPPDPTEDGSDPGTVCVGDHVPESIAAEAASVIAGKALRLPDRPGFRHVEPDVVDNPRVAMFEQPDDERPDADASESLSFPVDATHCQVGITCRHDEDTAPIGWHVTGENDERIAWDTVFALQLEGEERPVLCCEDCCSWLECVFTGDDPAPAEPASVEPASVDDVFQVAMLDVMREPFEQWLTARRLHLFRIPTSGDDLPTYGVGPDGDVFGAGEAQQTATEAAILASQRAGWVDPVTGLTSGPLPAAQPREEAVCSHGAHRIYRRPGQDWWEDEHGWTTCVKAPAVGPGHQVGHQPMPTDPTGKGDQ